MFMRVLMTLKSHEISSKISSMRVSCGSLPSFRNSLRTMRIVRFLPETASYYNGCLNRCFSVRPQALATASMKRIWE